VQEERDVLALANHPFLVKLFYAFQTKKHLYLVMEYCAGGNCGQLLKFKYNNYKEDDLKLLFAEVLLAIENLHS